MVSAYARTLTQVVSDALRFCNDYRGDNRDGFLWSQAECRSRANDLILELVRRTGILRSTGLIHLLANINVYNLPPDCLKPLRFQIHGLQGRVILPRTLSEMDLTRHLLNVKGDPYQFMADHLISGQIAFFPMPQRTGSTSSRDSAYGALRQVADATGNLPFDAGRPLREIHGVPFQRTGDGNIIRELVSPYGNIQVTYIRTPARWTDGYPDPDIPEWIHPFLKYGVAMYILMPSRKPLHILKSTLATRQWGRVLWTIQRRCEYKGPMEGLEPL